MWLLVCIFIMHECLYFALVFEEYIISLALGVKVEVFLSKHFILFIYFFCLSILKILLHCGLACTLIF